MAHATKNLDRIPLGAVDPNMLNNIRQSMDETETRNLAIDIISQGLLQYPAVKAYVAADEAGNEVTVYGIVYGNRRFAALREAQRLVTEHNERCARDNGFADVGDDYPFIHEFIGPESTFNDFTEIPVFVIEHDVEVTETDLAEVQIRENALRSDINLVDKMLATVALLDGGRTQVEVARMANCTQPAVSQYSTVIKCTIPEVHQALREGKINIKDALNLAKLVDDNKSPDRDGQLAALEELVSPTKSDDGGVKPRGLADLRKLRVELADPTAFASADAARRDAIRAVLMWVDNPEVSSADLLCPPDGGLNLDANMPELPAPKEAKPPKEPKAPKAPKAGKKAPAAPVATTAATSASAPPAAARPMLGRPAIAKKK